jgi:uncharacterized damage-inducible protein DinB
MRINRSLLPVAVAVLVAPLAASLTGPLAAQEPASGWRADFLVVMDITADKYIRLAEAIPQEKYSWRPGDGVRSVAEVLLHVAGANYGLVGSIGGAPPAGVNMQGFERSTTDQAAIVQHVRDAFAHFRAAVIAMPESDAERMVRWFGPPQVPARSFLYFIADHNGEHLGQLIAYARTNGVVPPWSGGND